MRLVLLLTALIACAQAETPWNVPKGASLDVSPAANGWAQVREPGWFTVDMPSSPHSEVLEDKTLTGTTFSYKKIAVSGADGLFSLSYVDFGYEAEATRDAHFIVQRFDTHPAAGLHLEPAHPATVAGLPAMAIDGTAEASSSANGAPFPIDVHARVLTRGPRFFQLQCSVPPASATDCDRFFASFHVL